MDGETDIIYKLVEIIFLSKNHFYNDFLLIYKLVEIIFLSKELRGRTIVGIYKLVEIIFLSKNRFTRAQDGIYKLVEIIFLSKHSVLVYERLNLQTSRNYISFKATKKGIQTFVFCNPKV